MSAIIFIVLLMFNIAIQAFLPKFLKESEAFGVYIPDTHLKDPRLMKMKNRYTQLVLLCGVVVLVLFIGGVLIVRPQEQQIVFWGLATQIGALVLPMGLYAKNHIALANWKKDEKWTAGQVERKVVDLQFREQLKLLPNMYFILPMLLTFGLSVYGLTQYDLLPDQLPTHWGPNGEADAFTEKSWLSVSSLPFLTLVLQGMLLFFNGAMKQSGAKIQVRNKKRSREQQLAFRKYTSWLLFVVTITVTLLMGYLQLTIIFPETMSTSVTLASTISFLVIILGSVLFYAIKVGQSGTRITVSHPDESLEGVIDQDDDRYWKFGMFYVNKNDPSIMVEKRFGIGWTINFGHKTSWISLLLLIGSIVFVLTLQ
ncbi:hypothetical protein HMPREF1210_03327 [Paenisporosarcina sp. HGH0030]|uniref:DUF1648 domain-containing protein n=1 Tax=Paenisporosarcina sp. HGH0030 TaxID=1078085 RepID=UPI00034E209B|nr:DUF5808 domain-containing protein [Paenisporosarcina sp. HGH0030]EPD49428.1 hypothetical protein HMPREF1210_03327 [Paenisporosarcina sp. HGH0030]